MCACMCFRSRLETVKNPNRQISPCLGVLVKAYKNRYIPTIPFQALIGMQTMEGMPLDKHGKRIKRVVESYHQKAEEKQ